MNKIYIFLLALIFFTCLGVYYLVKLREINDIYKQFTQESIIKIPGDNDIDIAFFDKNEHLWIVTKDRKGRKVLIRSHDHTKKAYKLPELNSLI